jgi:hypothetical protein
MRLSWFPAKSIEPKIPIFTHERKLVIMGISYIIKAEQKRKNTIIFTFLVGQPFIAKSATSPVILACLLLQL